MRPRHLRRRPAVIAFLSRRLREEYPVAVSLMISVAGIVLTVLGCLLWRA